MTGRRTSRGTHSVRGTLHPQRYKELPDYPNGRPIDDSILPLRRRSEQAHPLGSGTARGFRLHLDCRRPGYLLHQRPLHTLRAMANADKPSRPAPRKPTYNTKHIKASGRQRPSEPWGNWSPWTRVGDFAVKDAKGMGEYQLRVVGASGPLNVNRFIGVDRTGLLYWGTGDLADRLYKLVGHLKNPDGGYYHDAASQYYRVKVLHERFPLDRLEVRYRAVDTPNLVRAAFDHARNDQDVYDAIEPELRKRIDEEEYGIPVDEWDRTVGRVLERNGLWKYEQQHGELPPMNAALGAHVKAKVSEQEKKERRTGRRNERGV